MNVKGLPAHFDLFEGDLFDTRKPLETGKVRPRYEWHFSRMTKAREVAATLRAGCITPLGGYPGQWLYIGKCQTTLEAVKEKFPWSEIEGNHVKIYAI